MSALVKLLWFTAFVTLLYFAIGIVTNKISSYISTFTLGQNVVYVLHRLKICEAVNVYISAVIATWIINKIINYWGR